jgi:predicted transcriptional regulator
MTNHKDANETGLVRTSVLVTAETARALREMAEAGRRPLSYEIRHALEEYVAQNREEVAA